MASRNLWMVLLAFAVAACGSELQSVAEVEPEELAFAGARIDGSDDVKESPEPVEINEEGMAPKASAGDVQTKLREESTEQEDSPSSEAPSKAPQPNSGEVPTARDADGRIELKFSDLSLDELDDVQLEDLLDALLYPDEYEASERVFPSQIQKLDKQEVAIVGYMIPVVWEDTEVSEFMLVRDLLACCFGGAPLPDEWVSVTMPEGEGSEYFSFVPIIVQGTFHIAALEDEAGYAAGCYRMDGKKVTKGF